MLRLLLTLAALGCASRLPAAEPTHTVKLNGHTFTLPAGFEIELVAVPPLVNRPITADFDEQGRLYVTDSSGSNEKVAEQLKNPTHRVLRLEDADGDGKFDKSTVFADKMMFPEGTMWLNGSLYVAAPPHIWKLTDTDNDGIADKRDIWFDGKTLTGCANDLHGPYRGPDGYIYWCKGAFAEQTYTLPNGKPFKTKASHIFRATPDGKNIEPVMTGGMDNPVDCVFSPTGERFFSTTFLQNPAGGKRDGLIHAVYGAVYGKDHAVVYDHPWTSPTLMPPMTHLGPAAPCGLHRYESDQFGPGFTDNLFCAQFNMRKVSQHVLVPDGSTYRTQDADFVVSDSLDFHPTDVLEHADGSLLVLDTGGWYKLCCPTSQLVKADVLGGIYRVRKTGSHKVDDPWGKKIAWGKLEIADIAKRLHDPRPSVQRRAGDEAKHRYREFEVAVSALSAGGTERGVLNAAWLLADDSRIPAHVLAGALTHDARESVRLAAVHALAMHAPVLNSYLYQAADRLADNSLAVRRAAAEAVGRSGDFSYVPALLNALADEKNDRVLDHSLTYALIEIAHPEETAKGLTHPSSRVRRAALVALDNMPNGHLKPELVIHLLAAEDQATRETAWWIAGRHPEWGAALTDAFRARFAKGQTAAQQLDLAERLAKFAATPAIQQLLLESVANAKQSPDAARVSLKAMSAAGLRQPPDSWYTAIGKLLAMDGNGLEREAVATARALPVPKTPMPGFADALSKVARTPSVPTEVRFQALASIPGGPGKLEQSLFVMLFTGIHRDQTVSVRSAAADVLSRAALSPEQLLALTDALKTTGPMELDRLLEPFARTTDEKTGLQLLAALKDSPLKTTLRADMLKPRLAKYSAAVKAKAEELYAILNADTAKQSARLDAMLGEMQGGDIRRGQLVFNGTKAACVACHKIGYVGGLIGPDLTRIGGIRSERDLLEAVLFPSASFVRSYEPVKVNTADGKVFSGILKKDAPDEVVLTVSATEEARIARGDIEAMQPGNVSVMPAGLDQQLTRQELADLIAFLRACK